MWSAQTMKWLALAIGNSRLHWAQFDGQEIQQTWHTDYFQPTSNWRVQSQLDLVHDIDIPLCLVSVVPAQTIYWQPFATKIITLKDVPLSGLYPSLGIDRALAALGAGEKFGYPVLIIDGGTALTITGINADRELVGGAIWPGLRLQLQALHRGTAALPAIQTDWLVDRLLPDQLLIDRWATNTPAAITSGILYSTLAGIRDFWQDWQEKFPQSVLLITGGDGKMLYLCLKAETDLAGRDGSLKYTEDAAFWGIQSICPWAKM
jgi:type III pantothenate kinase